MNSFEQGSRKATPRLRHALILGGLLAFVAYFGVWGGYRIVEQTFGPIWATVAAVAAGLGLIVIGVIGMIVIRTMRIMEQPPPEAGNEEPPA